MAPAPSLALVSHSMRCAAQRSRPWTSFPTISVALCRHSSTSSKVSVQDSLKKYIRWYPQDTVTGSNIDTFLQLRRDTSRSSQLLVGVIYENDKIRSSSKLVDCLLADPLADGNETWYHQLASRSRVENNIFVSEDYSSLDALPSAFVRSVCQFKVTSPILDPTRRQTFPDVLPPTSSVANSLQLIEVNKPSDAAKLVDICSFYIYVTSEISTSIDSLPRHLMKKILLTVVDNEEYTPRSTETIPVSFSISGDVTSSHVIKVDSQTLASGIDKFLELDTKAGSLYFESIQSSNILEVYKFLSWFLRTENLRNWMFKVIKHEIASNNISEVQVMSIYEDLKLHALVKGSESMHSELQNDFIPRTREFFRKKFPWWKLYLQNDNVEYTIKDFFGSNFMTKSIDSYNYLKGQLVARLQEQRFANYSDKDKLSLKNPLQEFKADLINRIPAEIQPVVYSSIVTAFLHYQLPLGIISLVGYTWLGVDLQTAVAVTVLGLVLGFNQVSKTWHKFIDKWLNDLFEDIRLLISNEVIDKGLMKELNTRFEGAKDLARIKQQVIDELEAASEDNT